MSYHFERDPDKITNFLLCLLVLSMVISLVTVFSDFMLLDLLNGPIMQLQEQAAAADKRQQIIGIAYLIVFIFTGITFLTWINRANKNCHNFGAKNMKFTSGWSIGYYFVPFLNLYKPYQAMKEIWKVSKNPQNWENENGSGLIVSWWWLWLVNGFVSNALFKQIMKAETLKSIKLSTELSIASEVIYFPLCIVSILMINSLINRQKTLVSHVDNEDNSIVIENTNDDFYEKNINNSSNESLSQKNNNALKTFNSKVFEPESINMQKNITEIELDGFYEKALDEYENSNFIKSLYSRAIAEGDGNPAKERSRYINLRVKQLQSNFLDDQIKKKEEVKELNEVTSIFGDNIDINEVTWETSDKLNVKRPVNLDNLNLSGLSTEQKKLAIGYATELANYGSSLHGSKNSWRIKRGTSAINAYSLQDLAKKVQSQIEHYRSNKRE